METNDKVETSNEQTKKDYRFDDFQMDTSNEPDLKTESSVEEIGAGLDQEKNEAPNCIKIIEKFPDEAVPELICLVHANTNHKNFLSKEFSEFWLKKQKIVKISFKSITVKIQEIAEHRNSETLSRKAWMVKEQFLKQYGILEPDIPNKWNYILEQPGKKTTVAAKECEKDLDQVKHKAPNYNSSAYFYLSGSGGQKGPYPGIPNTKGLSEDESRGKIIEHFNKAQPTFISPEDMFCDKTELSPAKKSKKTQKVELKALAEEANEADIEMKLEPDSEEKPKPRQTKASKKAAKKSDEKPTKENSAEAKSQKEKSPKEK